jgi:hypothetical protein
VPDPVRLPAHEDAPALAESLVDVVDLERHRLVGAAPMAVPSAVLMTMVPASTAKLTGSTTGPVAIPNAIRPTPPGDPLAQVSRIRR